MAQEQLVHPTYTYAIKAGDFIKFGVAVDVLRRYTQINKDCPLDLTIIRTYGPMERRYAYKLEQYLHLHFRDKHQKNEWYRYFNDLPEYLDKLLDGVSIRDLSELVKEEKIGKRGLPTNTSRNLG